MKHSDCDLILLLYSKERLPRVSAVLKILFSLVTFNRIAVVINGTELSNLDPALIGVDLIPTAELVMHDNTGMEFGGYQAGLDRLGGIGASRLLVMNDTVGSHFFVSKTSMAAFCRILFSSDASKYLVGKIDSCERRMLLNGYHGSRWIRTHLFGMDRAALDAIGADLFVPSAMNFIRTSPDPDVFFGPEVGYVLKDHICGWLFSEDGTGWYGAQPLSKENYVAMADKARSIVQEKLLSMRMENADVAFRDTYLTREEKVRHKLESGLSRLGMPGGLAAKRSRPVKKTTV